MEKYIIGGAIILGSLGALLGRGPLVLLCLGVGGVVLLGTRAYVLVPDLTVAVVFNEERKGFARLLPAGHHWLLPYVEAVYGFIPLGTQTLQDTCRSAQASGGVPVQVDWSVSYRLDPQRLDPAQQRQLAIKLVDKADLIVAKHVNNCLQHVLSERTVAALGQPGSQARLEQILQRQVRARLAGYGIDVARVMIGRIVLPPRLLKALTAAQERTLQTEHEARALARLQRVISRFSDADMQRLLDLERIHALGQNGVALWYAPTMGSAATPLDPPHLSQALFGAQGAPLSGAGTQEKPKQTVNAAGH